ncbi:hypothetical protein HZC09_06865 [Candidatus Micrarchaeota archaeon]|nr:hypothetical protein [Candidatus Micrarchaeota archaeon]
MVNVTLSVPQELYALMKKHPEIKWTEVMRRAAADFAEKVEKDEFKQYAYAKSVEDWSGADELFEF